MLKYETPLFEAEDNIPEDIITVSNSDAPVVDM